MTKLTVNQEWELVDAIKQAKGVPGTWLQSEGFDGRAISGLEKKGFVGVTTSRKQFFIKQEAVDYVTKLNVLA